MKFAGIDIGSRSIKLAILDEEGRLLETAQSDTTFDPMSRCRELLLSRSYDGIIATGYGRRLFEEAYGAPTVSEILAHAAGAFFHFPKAKAVLDIGGQDTKAIGLGPGGRVAKFEMNDRCAAGTGKFLEVMARAFGIQIEEFGHFALHGEKVVKISSMCTVFAESEATSLMARGEEPRQIALGLHAAVARRALSMLRRVAPQGPLVFTGGVALNPCIRDLIQEEYPDPVLVPDLPHLTGALGAALLLREQTSRPEAGFPQQSVGSH